MKKLIILPLFLITIFCEAQSRIIGKPIKVGNFNYEVAQFDFPNKMTFAQATNACEALGKGWRLPTKQELKTLFNKKDKIGGFKGSLYWSSWGYSEIKAWNMVFEKGKYYGRQGVSKRDSKLSVRAVKNF